MKTKKIIKQGFIAGVVFALLMAGLDVANGENFQDCKFIFNTAAFGFATGFLTQYTLKKQAEKNITKRQQNFSLVTHTHQISK